VPVNNTDIADIFNRVAELLEIQGANPFRIRAYRNAAMAINGLSRRAADLVNQGESLSRMRGIGKDLEGKIKEIVKTGHLAQLDALQEELPAELHEVLKLPGLGPKRVKVLYDELDIRDPESLRKAAKGRKIRKIQGFGEKTENRILEELGAERGKENRIKLSLAEEIARPYIRYLKGADGLKDIAVAGSFRRRKETVGDLDILATARKNSRLVDFFAEYEEVDRVVSRGKTKSTVILKSGLQVDLRLVPQVGYGAALHYFTGSKAHNIAVRKIGIGKGLKINEYGAFRDGKRLAGRTEKEVFDQVDLPFIEPELRENQGEIEAAKKGRLPELVNLKHIRGDFHTHTIATDGRNSLEEMAEAARKQGYEYLAVSNHSKHIRITGGLDAKRLKEQIRKIDGLNAKQQDLLILKAVEVDILEDGSLDFPDSILKELDLTVCSVHSKFRLSRKKQTERIVRAMDNRYFHILGHPTGRLIHERDPYDVDMEKLMAAAVERGCFMELNAQPDRLDLKDTHCRMAKEMGVKLAVSTDAHSVDGLNHMGFGIWQARRGWLEPDDIINTRPWKALQKMLKR
jgi:DNA polymerase (family 10)